jgi:hypothetical protein
MLLGQISNIVAGYLGRTSKTPAERLLPGVQCPEEDIFEEYASRTSTISPYMAESLFE